MASLMADPMVPQLAIGTVDLRDLWLVESTVCMWVQRRADCWALLSVLKTAVMMVAT